MPTAWTQLGGWGRACLRTEGSPDTRVSISLGSTRFLSGEPEPSVQTSLELQGPTGSLGCNFLFGKPHGSNRPGSNPGCDSWWHRGDTPLYDSLSSAVTWGPFYLAHGLAIRSQRKPCVEDRSCSRCSVIIPPILTACSHGLRASDDPVPSHCLHCSLERLPLPSSLGVASLSWAPLAPGLTLGDLSYCWFWTGAVALVLVPEDAGCHQGCALGYPDVCHLTRCQGPSDDKPPPSFSRQHTRSCPVFRGRTPSTASLHSPGRRHLGLPRMPGGPGSFWWL